MPRSPSISTARTGYGQAFTDAINRDWGGAPLEDLRLGLAAAGREDPQLDTANACALGGSYGGFMVELDRRQLAGRLQMPGQPFGRLRPARHGL